jgi:hypothetical protein
MKKYLIRRGTLLRGVYSLIREKNGEPLKTWPAVL